MHQVRTHLAFVGLPLAGDALYGEGTPPSPLDDRHVLHAEAVSFDHPLTGVRLTIQAPLPTVAGWLTAG
jgi:23S rRNA pseudouridine1911/1915/1917 synthase